MKAQCISKEFSHLSNETQFFKECLIFYRQTLDKTPRSSLIEENVEKGAFWNLLVILAK